MSGDCVETLVETVGLVTGRIRVESNRAENLLIEKKFVNTLGLYDTAYRTIKQEWMEDARTIGYRRWCRSGCVCARGGVLGGLVVVVCDCV